MERPGRWRTFGLTNSMVCESRLSATMGGGLSQLSSSRKARFRRRTRRFAADEARHVSDETFRRARRNHFPVPTKPSGNEPPLYVGLGQTTGFDHVGVHPQLNLQRNS